MCSPKQYFCERVCIVNCKNNVSCHYRELKSMDDFNRTASVVATNIQKLVQNVSSMQRMLVHVDSQVSSHLFPLEIEAWSFCAKAA